MQRAHGKQKNRPALLHPAKAHGAKSPRQQSMNTSDQSSKGQHGGPRQSTKPVCGAKAKSTGRPCRKPAGHKTDHPGIGRCNLHGGKSVIKHGLYSAVVREKFATMARDMTIVAPRSVDEEIALMRAICADIGSAGGTDGPFPTKEARQLAVVEIARRIVDAVGKKAQIETMESTKLTPTLILQFAQIMEAVAARHFTKPEDFAAFGRDLRAALPLVQYPTAGT